MSRAEKREEEKRKKKKGKAKKIILGIFIVLLVIVLGVGGTAFWYLNNKIGKMNQVDIDEEEISVSDNQNLTGYRNIAIFGVDSREDDYGKGNRSDCIIIASINNKTHDVKLISVYRDTYVNIEGHGLDKITHAYSYGEAPLALKTFLIVTHQLLLLMYKLLLLLTNTIFFFQKTLL